MLPLGGLQGLGARAPGLLVQRARAWLDTLHRERKRAGERDQTEHVLDISAPSICLAEDYPQLSASVSRRKRGPAGFFEPDGDRIHQITMQKHGRHSEKARYATSVWLGAHFPKVLQRIREGFPEIFERKGLAAGRLWLLAERALA